MIKYPNIAFAVVLPVIFLMCSCKATAQSPILKHNSIYIEAGGLAGGGSINYERMIFIKTKWKLATRIGFGTYHLTDFTGKFNPDLLFPIAVNVLYGNKHHLECGIGQTISSIVRADLSNGNAQQKLEIHTNFNIGYRYQKPDGKWLFRCGYTPTIEFNQKYRHWGGLSFGLIF